MVRKTVSKGIQYTFMWIYRLYVHILIEIEGERQRDMLEERKCTMKYEKDIAGSIYQLTYYVI